MMKLFVNPHAARSSRVLSWDQDSYDILTRPVLERDLDEPVLLAGGDGTLSDALQVMHQAGKYPPIGLFSAGRANDLASALGLPADPVSMSRLVDRSQTRLVDLLDVNGYAVASTGAWGFPVEVATQDFPLSIGAAEYVCSAASLVLGGYTQLPDARVNGERYEELMGLLLLNAPTIGRHFRPSPDARLDDGYASLVPMQSGSRLQEFGELYRARTGRLEQSVNSSFSVSFEQPTPFLGDGEVLMKDSTYEIQVLPERLRFFVPR